MKIITLNMNMFRYLIDGSLNEFLKEYQADVVILQEVRSVSYTHLIKRHYGNIRHSQIFGKWAEESPSVYIN